MRRFYYVKRDYDIEMRLLARRAELPCVPQVFAASDNADGALRSPSGWPFPPYVVMERGATLREWLKTPRAFPAVLHMMHDLATQLASLHGGGYVHRDLSALANVLKDRPNVGCVHGRHMCAASHV